MTSAATAKKPKRHIPRLDVFNSLNYQYGGHECLFEHSWDSNDPVSNYDYNRPPDAPPEIELLWAVLDRAFRDAIGACAPLSHSGSRQDDQKCALQWFADRSTYDYGYGYLLEQLSPDPRVVREIERRVAEAAVLRWGRAELSLVEAL